MNKKIIITCIVALLILNSVLTSTSTAETYKENNCGCEARNNDYIDQTSNLENNNLRENQEIQQIQSAIQENNANWIAGQTSVSDLTDTEKKMRFGLIVSDEEKDNEDNKITSTSGELPEKWDWRNVSGKNFVTPVRSQGNCGSCWAFGTIAAVEAMMKVQSNNSAWNPDLSEQDLVSCDFQNFGCGGGRPDLALEYINKTGVVDEECFPYGAEVISCYDKCDNWRSRVTKLKEWGEVGDSVEEVKEALINHGPLVTAVLLFHDSFYYTSGEYSPVLRDNDINYNQPNHCIAVVGYNDAKRHWI